MSYPAVGSRGNLTDLHISRSAKIFLGLQIDADKIPKVRNLARATKPECLVRCGHTLVKLSKSHANPHGVLQKLLSAAADT
jgi:hypothetical protein